MAQKIASIAEVRRVNALIQRERSEKAKDNKEIAEGGQRAKS